MVKCRWNTAFSPSAKAHHFFFYSRRSTIIHKSPPKAYQAPFVNDLDLMDPVETFHRLWQGASPNKDPPGWEWSADNYLFQYMIAIEVEMGLRQPPSVSIPVSYVEYGEFTEDGSDAAAPERVSGMGAGQPASDEASAPDGKTEEEAP